MAERADAKPTKRVLLMEFTVQFADLPEEVQEAVAKQTEGGYDPEGMPILVPVAFAEGGPKHVIESEAKVRGRFRAIALDSFQQGHEAIPPEQQKFELKPL